MDTFLNILNIVGVIVFIVFFFGFCIFIHEFGHLLAAVWQGLYVDKFSIGFGKKIWGFKCHGIDFVVSMLPLGGYVSIPQLDPADQPKTTDGKELPFATPKARAITAFAGPFFNILFGFVLAIVLWITGVWQTPPAASSIVQDVPVVIPKIGEDAIQPQERIIAINGYDVTELKLETPYGTDTYSGGLYDLCAFWYDFPQECNLPTEDAGKLELTVRNPQGEERTFDYPVEFNLEYKAGLRPGDRIIAFNGEKFNRGVEGLFEAHAYNEHEKATLTVKRDGQEPFDISYVQKGNSRVEDLKIPFFQARNPITVGDVIKDSPAEQAGLKVGDQLLEYNGKNMITIGQFLNYLNETENLTELKLTVARQNKEETITIQLPQQKEKINAEKIGLAFIVTAKAVFQDSPADKAGIKPYDRLYKLNGQEVTDTKTFSQAVKDAKGKPLDIVILRHGKEINLENVVAEVKDANGNPVYILGVQLDDTPPKTIAHPSPWSQFTDVFNKTAKTLMLLFQPVTNFVTGRDSSSAPVKLKHMSSIVGISTMLWYTVLTEGFRGGLAFILLISFGLAFANLLPFPVLDGGHIMFAGIEFVIRRRLPSKFMNVISNVFAALLIALMLYITFNDVMRLPRIKQAYASDKPKLVIQELNGEKQANPTEQANEPKQAGQTNSNTSAGTGDK